MKLKPYYPENAIAYFVDDGVLVPVVRAYIAPSGQSYLVPCPYCGEVHTHGTPPAGFRGAHCGVRRPGDYFLAEMGELSKKAARALEKHGDRVRRAKYRLSA